MSGPIIAIIFVLILFWYITSWRHPKYFPPGPRLPFPLIGDAYLLGKDVSEGFSALIKKYGKTCVTFVYFKTKGKMIVG